MSISIEVNGKEYIGFVDANVTMAMDAITSSFSMEATSNVVNATSLFTDDSGGVACRMLVDGELVMTGNIEVIAISGSSADHTIQLSGRDKTGDLLDSYLDKILDFSATVSLKALCQGVIKHLGMDIEVVDETTGLESFKKAEDQITPDVGENAAEYLNKWARKREVLITSTPSGDLRLSQPGSAVSSQKQNFVRHRRDDDQNNVTDYSATFDDTGRYNKYVVIAQGNPVTLDQAGANTNASLVNQSSAAEVDRQIRIGRQLVLTAETNGSGERNQTRAKWEANVRKVRGRTYSCTVVGYRNQSGELWRPGDLVFVDDAFAGISADMRINDVTFTMGSDGFLTQMTMLEPNAYTLELDSPKEQKMGAGVVPDLTGEALLEAFGITAS